MHTSSKVEKEGYLLFQTISSIPSPLKCLIFAQPCARRRGQPSRGGLSSRQDGPHVPPLMMAAQKEAVEPVGKEAGAELSWDSVKLQFCTQMDVHLGPAQSLKPGKELCIEGKRRGGKGGREVKRQGEKK